jgi:hypothetical protein
VNREHHLHHSGELLPDQRLPDAPSMIYETQAVAYPRQTKILAYISLQIASGALFGGRRVE